MNRVHDNFEPIGIHLPWLLGFAHRETRTDETRSWTTFDLCKHVVKPATSDARCSESYAELLRRGAVASSSHRYLPAVGASTHFISHAWMYPVATLVGALSELTAQREWHVGNQTYDYDLALVTRLRTRSQFTCGLAFSASDSTKTMQFRGRATGG